MASIRITIETDGAAFLSNTNKDDNVVLRGCRAYSDRGLEVARILRIIATDFEHTGVGSDPRDVNGKKVGKVELID